MPLVSRSNKYIRLMKKIKTYESFFGGTHLGSDNINNDSSIVRNVSLPVESFSDDLEEDTIKNQIIDLLDNYNSEDLIKIKNFIQTI